MRIIDLHCDTLMECYFKKAPLRTNDLHISLEKMQAGGALAQCFAIFVPTFGAAEHRGVTLAPYEYYKTLLEIYKSEMAKNTDLIAPALTAADIIKNKEQGKMSGILTVEDCVAVDGKIERVDEMFADGVRMASLTWNYENSIAFPNSRDAEAHSKPLKEFGLQAVSRMDELGIIVDVSHLSEGGFWDIIKYGKKPFVASHSCARALCDHPRNLTDDQLKALGEKGGVVGINFCSPFLNVGAEHTDIADLVRHCVHIADKAGVDALAFGSDFDGIGNTLEFKDYAGMGSVADAMLAHFTPAQLDKMCNQNALRVFKEVIGE